MSRGDRILLGSLAIVVGGIATLGVGGTWKELFSPTSAAWVQAIGALVALFVAVKAPKWAADAEADKRQSERLANSQIYIISLSGPMSRLRHQVQRAQAIYDGLKLQADPNRLTPILESLLFDIPAELLAALGRTEGLDAKVISPMLLAVNSCVTHNSYILRTIELARLRPLETFRFLQTDWARMDSMMHDVLVYVSQEFDYSQALGKHFSSQK